MISEEKISHLSHVLLKGLLERGAIIPREDEGAIRREIKHSIHAFLRINEDIDSVVRKKLQSFSKRIIEGSLEWEVLYRKYHREETIKRGLATE